MEMSDVEEQDPEWFIFSSNTRNNVYSCLTSQPQLPLHYGWPMNHVYLHAVGDLTFLSFRSKSSMNQGSLFPITSLIQSLLYVQSRAESLSLLNLLVILETGSWTSHLQMKLETSFPHPQKEWLKKKRKGLQMEEHFFKHTKYFSSFLVLGKSINFLQKRWKATWENFTMDREEKSHINCQKKLCFVF